MLNHVSFALFEVNHWHSYTSQCLPSIIERVVIYITVPLTALHLCFILQLLDSYTFVNQECNRAYLMDTQQPVTGGFSKWPSHNPGS